MGKVHVAVMRGKPGGDRAKLEAFAQRLRAGDSVDVAPTSDEVLGMMVAQMEPRPLPFDLEVRIVDSADEVTPPEVLLVVGAEVSYLRDYPGFRQGVVAVLGSWVRSSLPRSSLPRLPGFAHVLGRAASMASIAAAVVDVGTKLYHFVHGIIMLPERRQQRAFLEPLLRTPPTRALEALRARIGEWIAAPGDAWPRVMAVCGERGSGKTALLAALADAGHAWAPGLALRSLSREAPAELVVAGAHFFGADRYVHEHTVRAMLFNVGEQLAMAIPDAFARRAQFVEFRDRENMRKWSDDAHLQFLALFDEPFRTRSWKTPASVAPKRRAIVVVDGLDACAAEDRPIVLRLLLRHWRATAPDWLGVVLSCRREDVPDDCDVAVFDVGGDLAVMDLLRGEPAQRAADIARRCGGDLQRARLMMAAEALPSDDGDADSLEALVGQRLRETGLDGHGFKELVAALCVAQGGATGVPLRTALALLPAASRDALHELLPRCEDLLVLQPDEYLRLASLRVAECALRVLGGDSAEAQGFAALARLCDGAEPDPFALENIVSLLVQAGDLDGLARRLCSFSWLSENLGREKLNPMQLGRDMRRFFLPAVVRAGARAPPLLARGAEAARALSLAAVALAHDPRELAAQVTARLPAQHPLRRDMPAELGFAWVRPVRVDPGAMRRHDFPVQHEMRPGAHWLVDLSIRGDLVCVSGSTFDGAVFNARSGRCLYRRAESRTSTASCCLAPGAHLWTSRAVYDVNGARDPLPGSMEQLGYAESLVRESGGFVAAAANATVRIFDASSRELVQTLTVVPPTRGEERDEDQEEGYSEDDLWAEEFSRGYYSLALYGDLVLLGGGRGNGGWGLVRLWNWRSAEVLFARDDFEDVIRGVTMDPRAFAFVYGETIWVHDAQTRALLATIAIKGGGIGLALNDDLLACGLSDGSIRFWTRSDWRVCAQYPVAHTAGTGHVAFGADFVASCSLSGNLVIWDMPTPSHGVADEAEAMGDGGYVDGINEDFAVLGSQHAVVIRSSLTGETLLRIPVTEMYYKDEKYGARAALYGDAVAVFQERSKFVELWSAHPAALQLRINVDLGGYGEPILALGEDAVAVMSDRGKIHVWDRDTGAKARVQFEASGDRYAGGRALAVSAEAVAAVFGGGVFVWARDDGRLLWKKDLGRGARDRVLFERGGAVRVGCDVFDGVSGALLRQYVDVKMRGTCDNAFGVYGSRVLQRAEDRGPETVGCLVDSFVDSVMACDTGFIARTSGESIAQFDYGT